MSEADLLVHDAELVASMGRAGEVRGGWVAISGGAVVGIGRPGAEPAARRRIDARGCLVTPGLVNTHHHLFQNLTRSYAPACRADLFTWLRALYPLWSRLDEEAAYLAAYVGLVELALSGCTTTSDHHYVFPPGAGDLLGATVAAARDVGLRFHPTRGSMSRSEEDGGLPLRSVCEDEDAVLAASEEAVVAHHDPAPLAMVRVGLAPCSPFSVSERLLVETADLAEHLDVRLHTHLAEDPGEDASCRATYGCRPVELLERTGWSSPRTWVAHLVHPSPAEIARLGASGVGVAHCPSSNLLLGAGVAPVAELEQAGCPVGLGCDGSSSADAASLWLEARTAMLARRLRDGAASSGARESLALATLGGAACLGRSGEIGVLEAGAAGDLACWRLDGVRYAGALSDPVEAWLRCGPGATSHTVVGGVVVVEDGAPVAPGLDDVLARHQVVARRVQEGGA